MQKLSIYLCFPLDDSYTPATIAVRAGTGATDLQDCRVLSLEKPDGWFTFDISAEPNEEGDGAYAQTFVFSFDYRLTVTTGNQSMPT